MIVDPEHLQSRAMVNPYLERTVMVDPYLQRYNYNSYKSYPEPLGKCQPSQSFLREGNSILSNIGSHPFPSGNNSEIYNNEV